MALVISDSLFRVCRRQLSTLFVSVERYLSIPYRYQLQANHIKSELSWPLQSTSLASKRFVVDSIASHEYKLEPSRGSDERVKLN